ncbi:MAG: hypothetical protein ACO1OO_00780 [Flavisolibacter sp.]
MEVTAAVLYDGALAHYDVRLQRSGECVARLASFSGDGSHLPPDTIRLRKEGRHWIGKGADSRLTDDLGYAVEMKAKPLLQARKRDGSHPAG